MDIFRPRHEPAKTIYDAFQAEAEKRPGRSFQEWTKAELEVVWRTARDYAQQHGLRVPLMSEVERADRSASGHVDYGAKLAYYITDFMTQKESV